TCAPADALRRLWDGGFALWQTPGMRLTGLISFGFLVGVVGRNICAGPNAFLRPWLRGCGPEDIVRGQAEMNESGETHIKTAGGNVTLTNGLLMADGANLQPAVVIEDSARFSHSPNDGCETGADGGRLQVRREFVEQRNGGQLLKGREAIGARSADYRKRSLGRNHSFLHFRVSAG